MLTKDDIKLFEQSTRKIVREEVSSETENLESSLRSEMKLSRMRIESNIHDLKDRIKNIEIKVNSLEKSSLQILKNVRKIKKDPDTHIDLTDKWILHLDKRVRRTENELNLTTPDLV